MPLPVSPALAAAFDSPQGVRIKGTGAPYSGLGAQYCAYKTKLILLVSNTSVSVLDAICSLTCAHLLPVPQAVRVPASLTFWSTPRAAAVISYISFRMHAPL